VPSVRINFDTFDGVPSIFFDRFDGERVIFGSTFSLSKSSERRSEGRRLFVGALAGVLSDFSEELGEKTIFHVSYSTRKFIILVCILLFWRFLRLPRVWRRESSSTAKGCLT